MPDPSYRSYGAALRVAVRDRLSSYDEQTITAFLADLYHKDFSEVERDIDVLRSVKVA